MEKNGNIGRVCRYCSRKATAYAGDVPVCDYHNGHDKKASAPKSLKDVEANGANPKGLK